MSHVHLRDCPRLRPHWPQAYNGIHISRAYNEHLRLMADMFAKPVSCLLADVVQACLEHGNRIPG
jgi:hypothetical protein